jgi:hypothetical protein
MVTANDIQSAHNALGHKLGWRFLYGALRTLDDPQVAYLALNPGGKKFEPGSYCAEESAYVAESWGYDRAGNANPPGESKLQRNVRAMFRYLGVDPNDVLAGNIVPFRSPSWSALAKPEESLRFGYHLWRRVFTSVRPRLVIAASADADRELAKILNAGVPVYFDLGYPSQGGYRREFDGGFLIRTPHLSWHDVFGRRNAKPYLDSLFAGVNADRKPKNVPRLKGL